MPAATLYFAYGSNLSASRLARRLGHRLAPALRASLHGYRVTFDAFGSGGRRYANLVPDASGTAWGVVYACTGDDFTKLDPIEAGYDRRTVPVLLEDGREMPAEVYLAPPAPAGGFVEADYLDVILCGARLQGIPEEYIAELDRCGAAHLRPNPD